MSDEPVKTEPVIENPTLIAEDKIKAMVEEQVTGLKKTNEELKAEKIKIAQQLDQFSKVVEGLGGLDALKNLGGAEQVKRMVEMKSRFEKDEQGKLLTEGKYDEWFDRRTEALRKDHMNQLAQIQTAAEQEKSRGDAAESAFRRKVLEVEVSQACVDEKVEPSAFMDVQLRTQNIFVYDPDRKRLVVKDSDGGIQFGKDGKSPKTIREWLAEQKDVSRHWWASSKGSGAGGSDRPGGQHKELAQLDFRDYAKARRASNQ